MLVDYAASDDDDDDEPALTASPSSPVVSSTAPVVAPVTASVLPSAAQLFDAPAPSASTSNSSSVPRKRPQVNGSSHPPHAPKVARSGPNSSSVRAPSSASLVPPQLRGRSNVATEDLDKLFVNRHQRKPE